MEDNIGNENNEIYSDRVRAGKRTYFFDVRSTRGGDYYVTITESKRVYKDEGFFIKNTKFSYIKKILINFLKLLMVR